MARQINSYEIKDLVFFLGGSDLEMTTIRDLILSEAPEQLRDKNLDWGAKASDYKEEIEACLVAAKTPVLIEMDDDLGFDPAEVIIIDHHGKRAGSDLPTSLHQVFDLLQLPDERWTRWFELVAANDRGYIPALIAMGASREEIVEVRRLDRQAQGITIQDETLAEQALRSAQTLAAGKLMVVRLPHSRAATVTDRLALSSNAGDDENLLVISPDQVNFFGSGDLIQALDSTFPGGWYGGALPERGFWGNSEIEADEVSRLLLERLAPNSDANESD